MMKKRNLYLALLAFTALLLLSGCVNVVQEMTVREDGSGSLQFAVGVEAASYFLVMEQIPDGFAVDDLLSVLLLNENVREVSRDQYQSGGRIWDTVTLEVDDFAALFEAERRLGPMRIKVDREEDVYTFQTVINLATSNLTIPGINLLDLSGSSYTVRLITPQIVSTNGLQTAAGTSVWDVPLSDLLQGGSRVNLRADYTLEPYEGTFIPWETFFGYVETGFLAAGILIILIVIVVNTRRKKEEAQKIKF